MVRGQARLGRHVGNRLKPHQDEKKPPLRVYHPYWKNTEIVRQRLSHQYLKLEIYCEHSEAEISN